MLPNNVLSYFLSSLSHLTSQIIKEQNKVSTPLLIPSEKTEHLDRPAKQEMLLLLECRPYDVNQLSKTSVIKAKNKPSSWYQFVLLALLLHQASLLTDIMSQITSSKHIISWNATMDVS